MNNLRLWNLVFLLVFITPWTVRSELLIFKTDENGFLTVLTDEESALYSNYIGGILLKYQWPMCIAKTLTEAEKIEYLEPRNDSVDGDFIQGREEIFIQKKLQNPLLNLKLHVVFIPTCLYELFCLLEEYGKHDRQKPFDDSLKRALQDQSVWDGITCANIQPLLVGADKSLQSINKSINDLCTNVNEPFYMSLASDQGSAFMYINNKIVNFLLKFLTLHEAEDAITISRAIYNASFSIYQNLMNQFKFFPSDPADIFDSGRLNQAQIDQLTELISKIIQLEYEAHRSNKALLLRGSEFRPTSINFKSVPETKLVAGNTVYLQPEKLTNLLQLYKKKELIPYSISFANSFFAGFLYDKTACAYHYLMKKTHKLTSTGYGLLINKKEYMSNQINNLFFIPSLSNLAALYEYGEFFHARTKIAIARKQKDYTITGLACNLFEDPYGFFVIEEDPLTHAERFARYLTENGRIIQFGDESALKELEKDFVAKIIKSQQEVANFYRDIRKIKRLFDQDVAPRYKAKKERRALAERQILLQQLPLIESN